MITEPNFYVALRFNHNGRQHPYVVYAGKGRAGCDPHPNFGDYAELEYFGRPKGCELGATAIPIDSDAGDFRYIPDKELQNAMMADVMPSMVEAYNTEADRISYGIMISQSGNAC